ncbi:hypothetical protein [Rhodococcus sp. USK13]|uniref:hypothetical protein n=1 Tax=Rhodococcus sp. USK13 TaxID=2806442 RepID=UPI001BCFDC2D|nr:hypothetical protein [Rhodococcus sp. USK13]
MTIPSAVTAAGAASPRPRDRPRLSLRGELSSCSNALKLRIPMKIPAAAVGDR